MSDLKPRTLRYFDYAAAAQAAGLSEQDLAAIERGTQAEYSGDDMLFELRMLRTCSAIRDGATTVRQVIDELNRDEASAA